MFCPNRNVFDTVLQFNRLDGLPSYLQRSCYIPKHFGKYSSKLTNWKCKFFLRLSIKAHRKQSFLYSKGCTAWVSFCTEQSLHVNYSVSNQHKLFPEITHQYILFAPLFLHLKHFERSALLCVIKRIVLGIGLNLRYSLGLLSQTNNFPYSLKESVSCVKLFSLKNFTLPLNEAPKVHYFCFLLLIQSFGVQQKSNKTTSPNTKILSTVKLALCVQSLCLLLHNNFLVFNIGDNSW